MSKMPLVVVGWFDDVSATPAFDPGLGIPCPVCDELLSAYPRTTISLMPWPDKGRSYFFRAHKSCWENCSVAQQTEIEGQIIDADAGRVS